MLGVIARLLVLLVVLFVVSAGALGWTWLRFTGPGPLESERTVVIERGEGVNAIARNLAAAGVLADPWTFRAGAALTAHGRPLRAGEYAFPAHASPQAVLDQLIAGIVAQHYVTVPEGLTSARVCVLLRSMPELTGSVAPPTEGSILPETYAFTRGEERATIVARTQVAMQKLLPELWSKRAPGLPLATPEEAVILASIVE